MAQKPGADEKPQRVVTRPPALRGLDGHSSMADEYKKVLEERMGHPFIQRYFSQIAEMSLTVPGHDPLQFWAVEFRDGGRSALAWRTEAGDWGAGEWRLCDTVTPEAMSMVCFAGRPAADSLEGVTQILEATRPVAPRSWLDRLRRRGA